MLTCGDIKPGQVFRYATIGDGTSQFIKLSGATYAIKGKVNAVNVATWKAAYVDERAAVELLGSLELIMQDFKG